MSQTVDGGFLGKVAIHLQRLSELAYVGGTIDEAEYDRAQEEARDLMDFALEQPGAPAISKEEFFSIRTMLLSVLSSMEDYVDSGEIDPMDAFRITMNLLPAVLYVTKLEEYFLPDKYTDTDSQPNSDQQDKGEGRAA